MSHYTVAVITDDIKKLESMLAPYEELYKEVIYEDEIYDEKRKSFNYI